MNPGGDQKFTEEEATRIWRRAAELQAARRLPAAPDPATAGGAGGGQDDSRALSDVEIVEIAREAGIEPEFVSQALTEVALSAPTGAHDRQPLRTRRTLEGPLAAVESVVREIATGEPYRLRFTDVRTTRDGLSLVFDMPPLDHASAVAQPLRAGAHAVGENVGSLYAVLLQDRSDPERTELILQAEPQPDFDRSKRLHEVGVGAAGAVAGGISVGALGAWLLALSGAAMMAPAAVGAAAFGTLGYRLVSVLHRWSVRKDAEALETLASEIAGAVRLRKVQDHLSGGRPPTLGS
jgi:hypothetical protein